MSTALTILRPARTPRVPSVLRAAAWVALGSACAVAVACSSNNQQSPDAFIAATMNSDVVPGLCPFGSTQQWINVGAPTSGKPNTVQNGNQNAGATVQVSCTVSAVGNGFDVLLSVTQEGTGGGTVTISSTTGQGAVTASGGTVTGVFESASLGSFRDEGCTISYTYQGTAVPDSPPIAAGRIWGHVSCPNAQNATQFGTGADGGNTERACDGEADFLFEQCGS